MAFRVITPGDLHWTTRPHELGEPARHVSELSDAAGFAHTRGNVWRYEPGANALTPLQAANHTDQDLLVYAYGYPPEDQHAEILESAL